jgi:Ulp1 family protease
MRILMILLVCKMHWKLTLNVRLEGKQGPEQSNEHHWSKLLLSSVFRAMSSLKGNLSEALYLKYPFLTSKSSERSIVTLHNSDLDCLAEGEFLNDNIIDFYLR